MWLKSVHFTFTAYINFIFQKHQHFDHQHNSTKKPTKTITLKFGTVAHFKLHLDPFEDSKTTYTSETSKSIKGFVPTNQKWKDIKPSKYVRRYLHNHKQQWLLGPIESLELRGEATTCGIGARNGLTVFLDKTPPLTVLWMKSNQAVSTSLVCQFASLFSAHTQRTLA